MRIDLTACRTKAQKDRAMQPLVEWILAFEAERRRRRRRRVKRRGGAR